MWYMKRILLACLSLLCGIAYAQKIVLDRIEEDGLHQIMTTTKKFSIGGEKKQLGSYIEKCRNIILKKMKNSSINKMYLMVFNYNRIS